MTEIFQGQSMVTVAILQTAGAEAVARDLLGKLTAQARQEGYEPEHGGRMRCEIKGQPCADLLCRFTAPHHHVELSVAVTNDGVKPGMVTLAQPKIAALRIGGPPAPQGNGHAKGALGE